MTAWGERRLVRRLARMNRLVQVVTTTTGTTVTVWTGQALLHLGLEQAAVWERNRRKEQCLRR